MSYHAPRLYILRVCWGLQALMNMSVSSSLSCLQPLGSTHPVSSSVRTSRQPHMPFPVLSLTWLSSSGLAFASCSLGWLSVRSEVTGEGQDLHLHGSHSVCRTGLDPHQLSVASQAWKETGCWSAGAGAFPRADGHQGETGHTHLSELCLPGSAGNTVFGKVSFLSRPILIPTSWTPWCLYLTHRHTRARAHARTHTHTHFKISLWKDAVLGPTLDIQI